jgi:hypothetical protein
LVALVDDHVIAGVGIKGHDAFGHELTVFTDEPYRRRGLATRLTAQAARRVISWGAVPTVMHETNAGSARVADSAGFPDRGWQFLVLLPPAPIESWRMPPDDQEPAPEAEARMANIEVQRLQMLVLLLACLPRDGKCREVLELALALDEGPPLAHLCPRRVDEDPHAFHEWLEPIWGRLDLTEAEHEILWWQSSRDNVEVAIGEIRAVQDRLGGVWPLKWQIWKQLLLRGTSLSMSMSTIDQSLYQSAVDEEFRAIIMANPSAFGIDRDSVSWPTPVEAQDQTLVDMSMSDVDIYACNTTCSWGMTILCDKYTQ